MNNVKWFVFCTPETGENGSLQGFRIPGRVELGGMADTSIMEKLILPNRLGAVHDFLMKENDADERRGL